MSGHAIVVEDEASNRELFSKLLQRGEIPHEVCGSAEVARERIGKDGITVAVIDIGLPGETGLDLAKWIQARHPDVEVILLTGDLDAVRRELRFDALAKPVEGRELVEKVREVLWRANGSREIDKLKRSAILSRKVLKLVLSILALAQAIAAIYAGSK